jgi:hypothetical protein
MAGDNIINLHNFFFRYIAYSYNFDRIENALTTKLILE